MKRILLSAVGIALFASCCGDRSAVLHIVSTGDIHGCYFDEAYVNGKDVGNSLLSVSEYVNGLRDSVGAGNVLLVDAGDCLQGDNAAYYFNYVDTLVPHVYPRIAAAIGYDVCVVGNHDIETGHRVYDKVRSELEGYGIPWLAGNALKADGKPYFDEWCVLKKAGLKVLVMGYDNANIRSWLSPELWSGMEFKSLAPFVSERVASVKAKVKPDVTVVILHSGVGDGDGKIFESQGLDVFRQATGADVVICGHDHQPRVEYEGDRVLVDGGSNCKKLGHAVVEYRRKDGTVSVRCSGETVPLDRFAVDTVLKSSFLSDYGKVRDFTLRPVGSLAMDLRSADCYVGMASLINLLHTVQLSVSGADISFAAPLKFNGVVKKGEIVYDDMFTIYPFENQLFTMKMYGSEVMCELEKSYDKWIQCPGSHVLRIEEKNDQRNGQDKWSFTNRAYNFDSAGGLVYTVDVTAPYGSRVRVESFADGRPFFADSLYTVAMTSYRANGGGGLLPDGLLKDKVRDSRIVTRYPAIRDMIYDYFLKNVNVTEDMVGDCSVIGKWCFVPEEICNELLESDLKLLFPRLPF